MKRLGLFGLLLLILCVYSGTAASSSMAFCVKTVEATAGNFKNAQCTEGGAGNFVKIVALNTFLGNGQWCAETETEIGNFKNAACTEAGKGKFIKVFAGPFWHVNNARLTSGSKQIKLQMKGKAVLVSPKLELEVVCNSSISESSLIEGNGLSQGQDKGRVSYSSCKVAKPNKAECTVTEPITTNFTKSYLVEREAQQTIAEVFEPTEGKVFVNLTFSKGCPELIRGTQPVDGSAAAELAPKGTEVVEGLLNFPTTAITSVKHEGTEKTIGLTIGASANAATFSAAYGAKLSTGEIFGASSS
jgi:hypothetical protein